MNSFGGFPTLKAVSDRLDAAVADGVFPGASMLVSLEGKVVHLSYHGTTGGAAREPVGPAIVYDIASVTKVLAMTSALMMLETQKRFRTDWPVARWIPEFRDDDRDTIPLTLLLAHRSGLPAHRKYYETIPVELWATRKAKQLIRRMAAGEPFERPPGTETIYSDLGFIVLEEFFERETGAHLDVFLSRELYLPLGMMDSFFMDLSSSWRWPVRVKIAPVTDGLEGVVDDENCRVMGGVSGHAGLFSTVLDLHQLTRELLLGYEGRSRFFSAEVVKKYWTRPEGLARGVHALGWDTPWDRDRGSASGTRFSDASVGHLGFTGTSVWIDPTIKLAAILLSNRVCPSRANEKIKQLRPALHDAVFTALSL